LEFKHDLPDNCPDKTVKTIEDDFQCYHLTKSYPPGKDDFQPVAKKRRVRENQLCQASGLSVLKELTDIRNIAETFPENGRYIIKGTVRYRLDGLIKKTPAAERLSHHTWYPLIDTNEHKVFLELEEVYEKRN
jgi:hypothetical protein